MCAFSSPVPGCTVLFALLSPEFKQMIFRIPVAAVYRDHADMTNRIPDFAVFRLAVVRSSDHITQHPSTPRVRYERVCSANIRGRDAI